MRTSLSEIKYIEGYLKDELGVEELLAFERRMQNDYHFRVNVSLQQKIYGLLRSYRQRRLKQQAETVHERLFNRPDKTTFRKSILQFF